jgi:single-strand DNA-binding protein
MNEALVVGRLGTDAQVKNLADGRTMVVLSVATSDQWTDKTSGERRQRTEWHRVVIFNDVLAKAAATLTKGRLVGVKGTMRNRKWTDNTGAERWMMEVVVEQYSGKLEFLDPRPRPETQAATGSSTAETEDSPPASWDIPDEHDTHH